MMKKKVMALLLSFVMVLQMAPVGTLASAADETDMELVCTLESHSHDDLCKETVLTCALEENADHSHGDSCYTIKLLCGRDETEWHTHSEACRESKLTCENTDATHTHEAGCHAETVICAQDEVEPHQHKKDCFSYVCGKTEHQHSEGCYAAVESVDENEPEDGEKGTLCETCGKEPCECVSEESSTVTVCETCHKEPCECPAPCVECGETDGHLDTCTLYVKPQPAVGDHIWIKPGEMVYKSTEDTKGYALRLHNYEIKITEVILDENGAGSMYKFEYVDLGLGELMLSMSGYFYVKVTSTSVEEPGVSEPETDPNACTCGEEAPENIAEHADACPHKAYIKSLVEDKTAEEIYEAWETYDETTQTDIMNLLEVLDENKFNELNNLLCVPDCTQVLEDGTKLVSNVPIIAKVTDDDKKAALESALSSLSDDDKGIFDSVIKYLDIDSESDSATITISDVNGISAGDQVVVLHFLDSVDAIEEASANPVPILHKIKTNSEVLSEEREAAQAYNGEANIAYYRYEYATVDENGTITLFTRSFSTFGIGKARSGNVPSLLRNDLAANGIDNLSIVEFPATLYNYYAGTFNQQGNFDFSGPVDGAWPGDRYVNKNGVAGFVNGGGSTADQGIMQSTTNANGLPQLALVDNGKTYVFDTTAKGKSVYQNVSFEFVYDKSTGYYTYNSRLSHAQFNQTANRVELYSQSLGANDGWVGGAYFFNDIKNALPTSDNPHISIENYKDLLYQTYKDLDKDTYTCDYAITTDGNALSDVKMHFGMQLDTEFYLPKDKKVNGEDIVFKFTGDDDMWVFIDGKLVLDIGGGHTEVEGEINLTDATSYVSDVSQWSNNSIKQLGAVNLTDVAALANLEADAMHRIQVFYLERMSWGSNCFISFNLPVFPEASVHVTKEVVADDGEELTIVPDEEYQFKLYVSKNGEDFEVAANTDYTVGKDTHTTDANGMFTLKHGQTAIFDGISRYYNDSLTPTKVYVEEVLNGESSYSYTQTDVSVDGAVKTIMNPSGTIATDQSEIPYIDDVAYIFTNRIQAAPLVVEKQVEGGADGLANPEQEFEFVLIFKKQVASGTVVAQKGTVEKSFTMDTDGVIEFKLKQGESITFPQIPVGMTYTLMEKNAGTGFHTPTYEYWIGADGFEARGNLPFDTGVAFAMSNGGRNQIIVLNKQLHTLTIKKNGADMLLDPNQTFIFHVSGPNNLEMDVVIVGNGSVTIPDLIYGEYTITEDESWSWRYEATNLNQTVTLNTDMTVTFQNNREEDKWLDGNSWCRNVFKGSEIEKDVLPVNSRKEADE